MSKRRLNKRQKDRITDKQQETIAQANAIEHTGLLISAYRIHADIETSDGRIIRCTFRQNLGGLVAGDEVIWQAIDETHGVITAVSPRRSVLVKVDNKKLTKPVAANIDQLIVVVAPQPYLITTLLDSYLVAAESLKIKPIILLNKIDLLTQTEEQNLIEELKLYIQLGYPVLEVSTYQTIGLQQLADYLANKLSVFVGQSGVGKSSLIAALVPELEIRIAAAIAGEDASLPYQGQHTTTGSKLYHLPTGGKIIDSPGVREFALWQMSPSQLAQGFIEFRPYLGRCKFSNCTHSHEPECALKEATKNRHISAQRFASYHKLVEMYGKMI